MAFSRPFEGASSSSEEISMYQFVNRRSLEEQFLQCSVCYEHFDKDLRFPKLLPCNHTFCLRCLKSVSQLLGFERGTTKYSLKCPTCRKDSQLGPDGLNKLPADHRIVQMMDFLSLTEEETRNICYEHGRHPLNLFCKKCEVPICSDCAVVSHNKKRNHEVVEISEVLIKLQDSSKELSKKLEVRSHLLENAKDQLTKNHENEAFRIKMNFLSYRADLDKKEQELLSQLEQNVTKSKEVIAQRSEFISDEISTFKKLYEQSEDAAKRQDFRKISALMQQMKEWENSSTDLAKGNDSDLQWYEYEPKNVDLFSETGHIEKWTGLVHRTFCSSDETRQDNQTT